MGHIAVHSKNIDEFAIYTRETIAVQTKKQNPSYLFFMGTTLGKETSTLTSLLYIHEKTTRSRILFLFGPTSSCS